MLKAALTRLKRSLLTWPDGQDWAQCLLIGALGLVLSGAVAWMGGVIHWQPHTEGWLPRLLSVMLVPAFTEELVFRGLLVPDRTETRRPILWIGGAVLVFIVWHVFEALVLLPGARMFLHPAFLTSAGLIGLACALMRYRTDSLWPGVILHGLLVWCWQVLLGGPDVAQLLRP